MHEAKRQRAMAVQRGALEDGTEIMPVQELHADERHALSGHPMIEDLDHMGAFDLCRGSCLPLEPLESGGSGAEVRGHELDRHLGLEREVLGNPDAAHPTLAQRADEAQAISNDGTGNHSECTLPRCGGQHDPVVEPWVAPTPRNAGSQSTA